jgi:hypothetical protein
MPWAAKAGFVRFGALELADIAFIWRQIDNGTTSEGPFPRDPGGLGAAVNDG